MNPTVICTMAELYGVSINEFTSIVFNSLLETINKGKCTKCFSPFFVTEHNRKYCLDCEKQIIKEWLEGKSLP